MAMIAKIHTRPVFIKPPSFISGNSGPVFAPSATLQAAFSRAIHVPRNDGYFFFQLASSLGVQSITLIYVALGPHFITMMESVH